MQQSESEEAPLQTETASFTFGTTSTVVRKTEISLKFFKIDISDSKLFEETFYTFEPTHLLTIIFFVGTDLILGSSSDWPENNWLPSAPPISGKNTKTLDTGFTVILSACTETPTSFSENLTNSSLTAQRPPLLPIPVTSAITYQPIFMWVNMM